MSKIWQEKALEKIIKPAAIESTVEALKEQGFRVATLNGSFDLLHAGHLHIIYEASKQADVLIVALNSDQSIKEYKSKQRPIVPLESRIEMMTALGFVDYVTWFDETTPCKILGKIKPHVHINGAEYGSHCIEAEVVKKYGGELYLVDRVAGLSTTTLINKIRGLCD
jgi:D-glycero-beta-D-manno-heptose 1-phosphate adenylyltransferase